MEMCRCRKRAAAPVSGLKGPFGCLTRPLRDFLGREMGARRGLACTARGNTPWTESSSTGRWRATQLVQKKLADMQTEIAEGLQASLRVGRPDGRAQDGPEMISSSSEQLRQGSRIARMARRHAWGQPASQIEYHVMRHAANLETVNTYEGHPRRSRLIPWPRDHRHRGVLSSYGRTQHEPEESPLFQLRHLARSLRRKTTPDRYIIKAQDPRHRLRTYAERVHAPEGFDHPDRIRYP